MKRVLLIAFHFPPLNSSSGLQRPLSLARYLPNHQWQPAVLTASASAYESVDVASLAALPDDLTVVRAGALDAARSLSIGGWYPGWLGIPDRWSSWLPFAVWAGLRFIRRFQPDVLWSTYPLATTHLVGLALHKITGLPWVADFRDPMVEQVDGEWFPENPQVRSARLWVERRVARHATAVTFCTDTAQRIYLERHLERHAGQVAEVIANGFDPEPFALAEALPSSRLEGAGTPRQLRLVHSGTLYPGPDRDPGAFLAALLALRSSGELPAGLRVILRATGYDKTYQPLIDRLQLNDVVELAPPIGYRPALREMLDADGLLLFQGHTSNPAVPAKVYEYLRARRPILAMADDAGETAALLRRAGVGRLLPIDDAARIEVGLRIFLQNLTTGTERVLAPAAADEYSRVHRVAEFATLFTGLRAP